jgi:ribosome-binding protein aMBF1 (putative translation factor)
MMIGRVMSQEHDQTYQLDIGHRSRRVGRFIARVRGELLKAVDEERRTSKLNQNAIAKKLGSQRSLVNRQLSGEASLTLRSVAELSWALGREISFELRKPIARDGQNFFNAETTTIAWKKPTVIGASDATAADKQTSE